MKDNEKYIEEFVKDIPFDAVDEGHRDVLKGELLQGFGKHRVQPTVETVKPWRIVMKSNMSKIAAAAVIIIGVVIGLAIMGGTDPIALGDVYARVQQVVAYSYRMEMETEGTMMPGMGSQNMEMDVVATISTEHGMKMETKMKMLDTGQTMHQQMYIMPQEKAMVMLMPDQKMYTRMTFDDDLLEKMKKQNNDPREMVKQMLGSEYEELGSSEIDGVSVQGFVTTDATYAAGMADSLTVTLWVDAETWLPFRAEIEMQVNDDMKIKAVLLDFEWDVEATVDDFVPVIPEDYKTMPGGDIEMPKMDAESAIGGLRLYSELSGKYPENLNLMTLMKEIGEVMQSDSPAAEELRQRMKESGDGAEAGAAMAREIMLPIQSAGMFYMTLVQEKKEPVYYGEFVLPGESEKVLLRWKLEEGLYSVIYGDLRVEEVTGERLAELEQ